MDWKEGDGFRWADLPVPAQGKSGFSLLPPEVTGILFTNTLDEWKGGANRVLANGSGVALGDFDGDGMTDIYFASLHGTNRLYKNMGHWNFQDVTGTPGLVIANEFCRGAVFADLNGDGRLDLLVATTGAGVMCFLNQGNGSFQDTTVEAGTGSKYGSVTLALADVDGNGTVDLYVANYRADDIRDRGQIQAYLQNGKLVLPPAYTNRLTIINGKLFEYGEPDALYLNDGHGRFSQVPWTEGAFADEAGNRLTTQPMDWGLCATFRDLNGDNAPDLYVCNDYWTPDRIWINDGRGSFRAIAMHAVRKISASSMGVDFADLTRSGRIDFFVADMLSRDPKTRKRHVLAVPVSQSVIGEIDNRPNVLRNTLGIGRGDGTFAEIADYSGVAASEWSWSPIFIDADLDGYEDLLIASGHYKDVQDLDAEAEIQRRPRRQTSSDPKAQLNAFVQDKIENARLYPHLNTPIVAYRNLGNLKFEDVTRSWGTDSLGVHHAIATADLDGDGDLDLVANNLGSAAGVYRNESSAPRVAVRLKGRAPNTQGVGGKIKLLGGAVPMQSQEVISGGRFMAGSEPLLVFATGSVSSGMRLEVRWRGGTVSAISDVSANRIYEIDESHATVEKPSDPPAPPKPIFEDASQLLSHIHTESAFDDFARQPSLPRKLSQLGPGMAWGDFNADGWDDLVIGSGKGGRMALFENDGHGGFKRKTGGVWDLPITRDQTGLILWRRTDTECSLLVGSANYEDGLAAGAAVRHYDFKKNVAEDAVPASLSSTGPIALTDMDGNGSLDLFVGGRVIPARYPEPASSFIYRHQNGKFLLDDDNSRALQKVGLVSGATWSDLDNDGFPELILACEWGPVRVFQNRAGKLRDATASLGLEPFTGWWTSVATADLDGDGRLDIVAGNWGLNTPYRASPENPTRLYYGPFSDPSVVDLIEAEYDPVSQTDAPRHPRDAVIRAIPDLASRFPTHKLYSEATIHSVLGPKMAKASHVQAQTLATTIFLNRGTRFVPLPLPAEAQFAPAFGINVADFNGDGFEDIFLAQNFFASQAVVPRSDAGRGLLLFGDGKGNLNPVSGALSGIEVYGESRGSSAGDFDADGRCDLAITQNGAQTKLLRNINGTKGLRVRLAGPPENRSALGAIVRLKFQNHYGPARQITGGGGYLSQDSAVQILATPEPPILLSVLWPGGRMTETPLTNGMAEVIAVFPKQ